MYGRFARRNPTKELADFFRLRGISELPPRFKIAPTQNVAAVRRNLEFGDGKKLQRMLRSYSGDDFEAYSVSTVVNSPQYDVEYFVQQVEE